MKGINTKIIVQFNGTNFDISNVVLAGKEMWKAAGNKIKDISNIGVYFNANEGIAYCVINNDTFKINI